MLGTRSPTRRPTNCSTSLRNPVVDSPIVGATKPHHLADAVAALDIVLTGDEVAAVEAPYAPRQPTYFN